jgi:predicted AAA+ superfamily ATPase
LEYKQPKHLSKFNITFIGQLMESLVYQSLRVYADFFDGKLSHFRDDRNKREIDFILQVGQNVLLFEVKTTPSPSDDQVQHMNWFAEKLGDEFKVIKILLNTGPYAYTRNKDNVHVVPISQLSH